jgi:hypothetical protein
MKRSMAGWIRGNWNAWSVSHWSNSSSVEVAVAARGSLFACGQRAQSPHSTAHIGCVPIGSGRFTTGLGNTSHDENLRVDTSEVATGQRREGARSVDAGIPKGTRSTQAVVTGGDCPTAQDTMGWFELRAYRNGTREANYSSQVQRWRRSAGWVCVVTSPRSMHCP